MGRVRPNADEKDWIIRFVTDRRSRKVSEIRRSGTGQLVFQDDGDDAFVLLTGKARMLEGDLAFRQHWKEAYETYFPSQSDRENVAFIELEVHQMRLWIRGVTSEPFGLRPSLLERNAEGGWHILPDAPATVPD